MESPIVAVLFMMLFCITLFTAFVVGFWLGKSQVNETNVFHYEDTISEVEECEEEAADDDDPDWWKGSPA